MRRFILGSVFVNATFVALLVACDSDTTSEPPATIDAGPTIDASPGAPDANNASDTSTGTDAGADTAAPCPIGNDATITATLKATTDDNYKLYVNGTLIDDVARVWSSPQTYSNIQLFRNPTRKNVIAIEGINTANQGGLDRGVIVDLSYTVDATLQSVLTDATWKVGTSLTAGWFDIAFAETGWVAATVEAAHGDGPWGAILGTSTASWLWSYDSAAAAAKPTNETIYLRKSFYIGLTGAPQDTPGTCP